MCVCMCGPRREHVCKHMLDICIVVWMCVYVSVYIYISLSQ